MVVSVLPEPARVLALAHSRLIREIDDPNLGDRWQLSRDLEHPGGPGRLVRVASIGNGTGSSSMTSPALGPRADRLAIHAGERLIVESRSPVAEVRLRAVALESAELGRTFKVRLEIGGKLVRAAALGAGRAEFLAGEEAGQ
jgi:hypothetical protein